MKKGSFLINALSHTIIVPLFKAVYLSFDVNIADINVNPSCIGVLYTQINDESELFGGPDLIDPQHKGDLHKSGWSAHDSNSAIFPYC